MKACEVLITTFHGLVHNRNHTGHTPIIVAALKGLVSVVQMLLDVGACPFALSPSAHTACMKAPCAGKVEVLKTLRCHSSLSSPMKDQVVNHPNDNLTTPLMRAAQRGRLDCVALLLS